MPILEKLNEIDVHFKKCEIDVVCYIVGNVLEYVFLPVVRLKIQFYISKCAFHFP